MFFPALHAERIPLNPALLKVVRGTASACRLTSGGKVEANMARDFWGQFNLIQEGCNRHAGAVGHKTLRALSPK
jgi:hypothetical protein